MKAELASRVTCQHRDAFPCLIFPTSDRRVSSLVAGGIMEASFHSTYCNHLQDPHSAIVDADDVIWSQNSDQEVTVAGVLFPSQRSQLSITMLHSHSNVIQ